MYVMPKRTQTPVTTPLAMKRVVSFSESAVVFVIAVVVSLYSRRILLSSLKSTPVA